MFSESKERSSGQKQAKARMTRAAEIHRETHCGMPAALRQAASEMKGNASDPAETHAESPADTGEVLKGL